MKLENHISVEKKSKWIETIQIDSLTHSCTHTHARNFNARNFRDFALVSQSSSNFDMTKAFKVYGFSLCVYSEVELARGQSIWKNSEFCNSNSQSVWWDRQKHEIITLWPLNVQSHSYPLNSLNDFTIWISGLIPVRLWSNHVWNSCVQIFT